MAKNRPIKKYRVGSVEVAIWENQVQGRDGENRMTHSATLERRYREDDGTWKGTKSLRETDLPRAMLGLSKAYEFIALREPELGNGVESNEGEEE